MATIAPITPDYDGQQVVFTAAAAGGDAVAYSQGRILLVNNTSGASRTVTIPIYGDVLGQSIQSRAVTCPTAQVTSIKLGQQMINPTTGLIGFTYSSEVGVGIAYLEPPI